MLVKQEIIAIFLLLLFPIDVSVAAPYLLPDPDELHAVPTVLRALSGFTRMEDRIFMFGPGTDEYVQVTFRPQGKTRAEVFGEYTQAVRLPFPVTKYPGVWRGVLQDGDGKRIIWDASMLQIARFAVEKKELIHQNTIAMDMVKPPRDRMGEATAAETKRVRDKIRKNYRKVFGPRFSGAATLPTGWIEGKKTYVAFATVIEDFPLTVMGCESDDLTSCMMERFCYLESKKIKPKDIAGVGVSTKGNIVVMGDAGRHQVQVYRWNSCFDVRHLASLQVPKWLQRIASVNIDADDNLWIGTTLMENKFDSNLYYWSSDQWRHASFK